MMKGFRSTYSRRKTMGTNKPGAQHGFRRALGFGCGDALTLPHGRAELGETDFACRENTAKATCGTVSVRSPRYLQRNLHRRWLWALPSGDGWFGLTTRRAESLELRCCPGAGSARHHLQPPAQGWEAAAAALQTAAARRQPRWRTDRDWRAGPYNNQPRSKSNIKYFWLSAAGNTPSFRYSSLCN